jgi:hypothetical protein
VAMNCQTSMTNSLSMTTPLLGWGGASHDLEA